MRDGRRTGLKRDQNQTVVAFCLCISCRRVPRRTPLSDIHVLEHVGFVMKEGTIYKHEQ